jgi:hypothetical protein
LNRRLRLLITSLAMFLLVALPAEGADKLPIPAAREKALTFAENICAHDKSCANAGVQSCRRLSDRIVLCRIFDHRKTEKQGNFVCTRLVRLALKPGSHRVSVTGVGDWSC